MNHSSRRDFLKMSLAAGAAACALRNPLSSDASPYGLPIGLQLYSVRELLPKDFSGTLKQLGQMGYTEVEAAGFYDRSAKDFKAAMTAAGLRCVSAHYPLVQLQPDLDAKIAYGKELGLQYMVCSSPSLQDPGKVKLSPKDPGFHEAWMNAFTLDDWKWNAQQFNEIGKKVKAAGMRFGYHNHVAEFHKIGDTVPYDELLRLTDPGVVTYEMDCGWVTVAGYNPVDYIKKYPNRISLLHVKDFDLTGGKEHPKSVELGHGALDVKGAFAAAKKGQIKHYFIEQEEFFDMPPLDALKADADYMKKLTV